MKKTIKKIIIKFFRFFINLKIGRRVFQAVLDDNHPMVLLAAGRIASPTEFNLLKANKNIGEMKNFEDLSWLFFSNAGNMGIIKMMIDEAAYMFKIVRQRKPKVLFEIGTYLGGGAVLLSVAKEKEAKLYSIDLLVKSKDSQSVNYTETIKKFVDSNTYLTIGDSRTFIPSQKIDFIFIDGDHSYEGVKADFEHYLPFLNNGADIFFHDALAKRFMPPIDSGVSRFIKEIENNPSLTLIANVGSTKHFRLNKQ